MRDYEFGNLVYKLRKDKGLTQSQLGEKLGVSNKAVSKWENGVAKPNVDLLYKLADFFEISVDELVSGKLVSEENEVALTGPSLQAHANRAERKQNLLLLVVATVFLIALAVTLFFALSSCFGTGDSGAVTDSSDKSSSYISDSNSLEGAASGYVNSSFAQSIPSGEHIVASSHVGAPSQSDTSSVKPAASSAAASVSSSAPSSSAAVSSTISSSATSSSPTGAWTNVSKTVYATTKCTLHPSTNTNAVCAKVYFGESFIATETNGVLYKVKTYQTPSGIAYIQVANTTDNKNDITFNAVDYVPIYAKNAYKGVNLYNGIKASSDCLFTNVGKNSEYSLDVTGISATGEWLRVRFSGYDSKGMYYSNSDNATYYCKVSETIYNDIVFT